MNSRLFWKALVVQAVVVAIPFAILGLALDEDFFEDWGWLVGPVIWLACSALTGRILALPLAYVLFSAVAGGIAGLLVMLATSHLPGLLAALLVFAASCGSYDPQLEARERAASQVRRALADLAGHRAAAAPAWEATLRAVADRELDPLTAAERLLDDD